MGEQNLTGIVKELLHELNNPERRLSTIVRDFDECGIDYCLFGSLAERCHNYLRAGGNIDVLVSRKSFSRIEEYLIGSGYSRRQSQRSISISNFLPDG
jgi:hypothetical protein